MRFSINFELNWKSQYSVTLSLQENFKALKQVTLHEWIHIWPLLEAKYKKNKVRGLRNEVQEKPWDSNAKRHNFKRL